MFSQTEEPVAKFGRALRRLNRQHARARISGCGLVRLTVEDVCNAAAQAIRPVPLGQPPCGHGGRQHSTRLERSRTDLATATQATNGSIGVIVAGTI